MAEFWVCQNKKLIPKSLMCDSLKDCKDGEDEADNVCFGSSKLRDYALYIFIGYLLLGGIAYCCK